MNDAVHTTVAFLLIIGIGFLMRSKIPSTQVNGIKTLILSLALPAMIFVALLSINIEVSLLYLPALALIFNLAMALATVYLLPVVGIQRNSPENRTLTMLLPSLAPGLSCFPYLLEYLGEEIFAWAALADVGNKIFVLIILYLLAMSWFYRQQPNDVNVSNFGKIKSLCVSLVNEPVNMVIITALTLLIFGFKLDSLPSFLQNTAGKLSVMMTPLILLYIGLAVRVTAQQLPVIMGLLIWRSGMAFVFSAALIAFLPPSISVAAILLVVAFPQSSASFWPFAHITAISSLEDSNPTNKGPTFDKQLALAILAFSLPFSTIVILCICVVGETFFVSPNNLMMLGIAMIVIGASPLMTKKIKLKLQAKKTLATDLD